MRRKRRKELKVRYMYRRERERRLLHGEEKGGGEVKGRLGRERERMRFGC